MKQYTFLYVIFIISSFTVFSHEIEFTFDIDDKGDVLPSFLFKAGEEAYQFNIKGLDELEIGNFKEALDFFNKAMEMLPNYTDAKNNCGVVYYRKGNVVMAKEIWKDIINIDPDYATAYYNLGIVEYSEKKYEAAKEYFTLAVEKNKRFVDALVMLGRVELILGDKKSSIENLKKAYNINPMHQGAWGTLAYSLIQKGDTADAEKVLLNYKKNAYALKMLGQIEARRGNIDNAINYLTNAVMRGADTECLLEIAQIQLDSGNCSAAIKTMESYIHRTKVPSADAWHLAGMAAKECGNLSQTKRYFEQGIQHYPSDQLLRFNLGQVYFYQKDYENADKVWRLLSDTINDPSLFHLRAISGRKINNLELAEKYIRKSILLDPKAEYFDMLGVILYESGRKDEAVKHFKRALALNPSLRSAQLNIAVLGKTDKNIAKAVTDMKKEIALCKADCAELYLKLSILYYHSRQYEKAVKTLEKVPDKEKNLRIYRHLALYFKALAEFERAIEVLEKAQEKIVLDLPTEYELAEIYLEAGLYTKAIVMLKNIIPMWDKNPWRLYYQLGYAHVKQNEFDLAKKYLKKSLEKKEDNIAVQSLLAFIYNVQGETRKARNIWERNLKEDPSNPVLWINMGLMLEKEGKYKEAIEKYQKALSLSPDDNSVQINIGNAYASMDKMDKAHKAYLVALDSEKRCVAAYNVFITAKELDERNEMEKMAELLEKEFPASIYSKRVAGELLLYKGDTTSSLKVFENISEKNAYDWHTLAGIYLALGKIKFAENAIKKLPNTPQWQNARKNLRAQSAYLEGNYKEAMTIWKDQSDTSFDSRYNMALAAFNAENYETAIQIGNKIAREAIGQDRINIYRLIGNSAVKIKDWKEAESWFRQVLGLKSDDAVACYNMAVAEYNLDKIENAWEWYQRARKIDPSMSNSDIENKYKLLHSKHEEITALDTLDILYNQAVELQQKGDDKTAEDVYRKIVETDGRFYRAWNNLGAIYGARGELDKAIDCYENSVSRRADIADGYANLVNIYIALEDFKEAEKWLRKGQRRNPDSDVLFQMEDMLNKAKEK